MKKLSFRELVKNKLPKFCAGIFSSGKAKNTGDAGHLRVFLTPHEEKRISKMGRLFISNSLYLFLILTLSLTSCTHLIQLNTAQDAFSKGAVIENTSRFTQTYSEISPEMYYSLAYADVQKALKKEGKLEKDGVKGNALTLKALCQWKLNQYANAKSSAIAAVTYLESRSSETAGMTRDLAVMKAMDGLILIDEANASLAIFDRKADDYDALKTAYQTNIWGVDNRQVGKIQQAIGVLEGISREASSKHEIQIYLLQSQLAGMKIWNDALDGLKNSIDGSEDLPMEIRKDNLAWYKARRKTYNETKEIYFTKLEAQLHGGKEHDVYKQWLLILGV